MKPVLCFFFIGKLLTRQCAWWLFHKFQPMEQKLLNFKLFLSLEINQKSKKYFSTNQCFFIILLLEFTFASSYHMMKCICLFVSWGNAWGVSHWPSQPINASSCDMRKCICLHVMKKCMRSFPLTIAILPFSHLNQSMPLHVRWENAFVENAFASLCHGGIHQKSPT
jgi:hypothetical protein